MLGLAGDRSSIKVEHEPWPFKAFPGMSSLQAARSGGDPILSATRVPNSLCRTGSATACPRRKSSKPSCLSCDGLRWDQRQSGMNEPSQYGL
jgi:hypothetical protein